MEPGDLLKSELPHHINETVEKLRKNSSAGGLSNVEIEGRLGHFNKKTKEFVPGVSERYFNEMKMALLNAYNAREKYKAHYIETRMLDVFYNNKIRVSVDETTGKVFRDSRTNKITGVIIKEKEKKLGIDFDIKNHYSLRIGISRETLLEDRKKRADAEHYVKATEELLQPSDRIQRIQEGARLKIKDGSFLKILLNSCDNSDDHSDPLIAFAKKSNYMLPSNIVNEVQWVIEDLSCVSSLDRRLIEYHDKSKFKGPERYGNGQYRIISLAGAFHKLPGVDYFPIPYGAYTGIIHIGNIETVSNYKKLVLHKNPDFQPINFRRKIRTTFVLKDGNSKHVVDMSITKFSEQGLENLEDCSPRYEVEYDYNGKDNGANNHVDFLKGMVTLLYSVSPNTTGNSKKRRHGRSTTIGTKRRRTS
jgi:hypothetical protein